MEILRTHLNVVPPFDFGLTASYRTRFNIELGNEEFRNGVFRRMCTYQGKPILISLTSTGTADRPLVEMNVVGEDVCAEDLPRLAEDASWLLGLDYDLAGFYSLAEEDPVLAHLVRRFHGLKPPRETDIFETLITTIIGQQISAKVAVSIHQELVTAFGERFYWEGSTYYLFPTPESLVSAEIEGLRRHKLSQRKAEYIYGIAKAVMGGHLDLEGLRELSDERVISRLTELRGIGVWTAQWVLCNALGRFDIFPAADLALLRILSRIYLDGRGVTSEDVEAFSERWGVYKVPVITYLYAAIRQGIDLSK